MGRVKEFRRNSELEDFLKEINEDLFVAEKRLLEKKEQRYPIIFILGPLRSGTTLMTQWLAASGKIAYPTNMLSRFYGAPVIGAKIQKLLTDEKYNFRNEILDFSSEINYHSENGKTKGALAPNEFWYFWRRFIPYVEEIGYLTDQQLMEKVDVNYMLSEFIGLTETFEKPFVLKATHCNYNIGFLDQVFDKALFLYMKRDPYTNTESSLKARERQLGTIEEWYSFKIPEYSDLSQINNPIKQTAGQVYHNNKAVQEGLAKVAEHRKMIVEYEDFCENPEKYYKELVAKLGMQGCEIDAVYNGEKQFNITRKSVNPEIEKFYNEYVQELQEK